jgi:small subunit ribosomal protein S20
MPNKRSAEKALRQSAKKAARNAVVKAKLRDLARHFRKSVEANDAGQAKTFLDQLVKAIDKAAKRGIMKKNTASRKKSRMTKRYNAVAK